MIENCAMCNHSKYSHGCKSGKCYYMDNKIKCNCEKLI